MKIYHLGLFLILLLVGCSNPSNETIKLNNILLRYHKAIPHSPHLYIIRNKFYCEGCVQSIYLQLEKKLSENRSYPITIISEDRKYISVYLLSKIVFIQDTLNLSKKVYPKHLNITIFVTNNGKIKKYKNMSDSQKINLPKFVNEFLDEN